MEPGLIVCMERKPFMKWIQSLDPFLIMTSRASTVYINRLFKSRINTDSTWLTLLTWAGTNSHRRCCIETLCGLVFNNECTVFTNTGCSSWIKGKTLAALRFHILSLLHDQQCFFILNTSLLLRHFFSWGCRWNGLMGCRCELCCIFLPKTHQYHLVLIISEVLPSKLIFLQITQETIKLNVHFKILQKAFCCWE